MNSVTDLIMLSRILHRIGIKVETWEADESIAVTEHGPTGGTLSRSEANLLNRVLLLILTP